MNIRKMLLTTVALSAVTTFAETTVEGISVSGAGFTVTRYRPVTTQGAGRDEQGNELLTVVDGPTGGKTQTGLRLANIQNFIDGGMYDMYKTTLSPALAGYKASHGGVFAYDGCAPDGGYPGENRYDRTQYQYFTMEGKINVPSDGMWTFGLGGREYSLLSLSVSNADGEVLSKELTSSFNADGVQDWQETHYFPCELAKGEYTIKVAQYSHEADVWYEVSAMKGNFFNEAPEGHQDMYTWKGMALVIGTPLTTYDVTFDTLGGPEVETQHVKSGLCAVEPTAPQKAGSAFICWTADPQTNEPYDFSTAVTADLTLTAVWEANVAPVIESVTCDPEVLRMTGSTGEIALRVTATDMDGDELTYAWTVDGDAPAPYSFSDATSATPTATVNGGGTYVFKVTVSDGHETVSSTVSVIVTVSLDATTFEFAGCEATTRYNVSEKLLNPSLADYPWTMTEYPNEDFKAAWRSTNTVRKTYLLDDKRVNAYGLDGYAFMGGCRNGDGTVGDDGRLTKDGTRAEHVTSGTVVYDRDNYKLAVSNVTPYIAELDFERAHCFEYVAEAVCEAGNDPVYYCIDDPREEISGDVADFQPSSLAVHVPKRDEFIPFATIRFSRKVMHCSKVRVGFLCGSRENFKPAYVSVGSTSAPWGGSVDFNRNRMSTTPDWMFFDINNPKSGGEVTLSIKVTDNQWDQGQIHGIIFDSLEKNVGFAIYVR